jgi:hypothetical protein
MTATARRTLVAAAAAAGLALSACSTPEAPFGETASTRSAVRADGEPAATSVTTVVAVSVDGLNPAAIRALGPGGAPTLHRLIEEGASTLNARTEREQTETLPNHTGMLTGRRIRAASGGHGVTWNDERLEPRTVQAATGHPISSVFSLVHAPDRGTALFASKEKFSLFGRSWAGGIDRFVIRQDNRRLTRTVRHDIADHARAFRFVHYSWPDVAGHEHRFMSPEYLDAVADVDRWLGRILVGLEAADSLDGHVTLVVTADHGGRGPDHVDPTELPNYRVPFIVWGAGVEPGADLYDLNPDYADPGTRRTTYAGDEQPVRNGDVANLVTDLLGLGAVPGSEHDAGQDLDVR